MSLRWIMSGYPPTLIIITLSAFCSLTLLVHKLTQNIRHNLNAIKFLIPCVWKKKRSFRSFVWCFRLSDNVYTPSHGTVAQFVGAVQAWLYVWDSGCVCLVRLQQVFGSLCVWDRNARTAWLVSSSHSSSTVPVGQTQPLSSQTPDRTPQWKDAAKMKGFLFC